MEIRIGKAIFEVRFGLLYVLVPGVFGLCWTMGRIPTVVDWPWSDWGRA